MATSAKLIGTFAPRTGSAISYNVPSSSAASSGSSAMDQILSQAVQNNAWSASQAEQLRDWQSEQNKIAMDFNAEQAALNRDWQEYMSNTAHQREVRDLLAAGLNPVLSAMGGNGAAVTSGATASGVTSAGAKGDTDTSVNGAIASILASVLNAQTQLQAMNTNAITNLAVADKYTAMSKFTSELDAETRRYAADLGAATSLAGYRISAETALKTANIQAAASRYVSDNNLKGSLAQAAATKISAILHSEATKYAADKGYLSAENVADINASVNKELKQMGIDAYFDFAREFPSNEWQYDPGQANAREWVDSVSGGFRNIVGYEGLGGLLSDILSSLGTTAPIGFKP